MPPNPKFPIKCAWAKWNVSLGFQLLIAQPNIIYILQWKKQFQTGKGGS